MQGLGGVTSPLTSAPVSARRSRNCPLGSVAFAVAGAIAGAVAGILARAWRGRRVVHDVEFYGNPERTHGNGG